MMSAFEKIKKKGKIRQEDLIKIGLSDLAYKLNGDHHES
jgi:hypothetical protein